ncbi:Misato segment II tubulin-like domain-containing protein [Lipomyces japonicus]|uniref:Misato segment II tubulin-like domain-containing protein n=1 Tax=Lipomyces japonicus TaxID=56871 RepID=UPI0034CE6890
MREIIHLSFSTLSNHLSTHFFNAQDYYLNLDHDGSSGPVDHNVTFRSGIASDGSTETYTPRCLLWELKGGYGSLKKYNELYDWNSENVTPSGVVRIEQPRIQQNEYIKSLDTGTGSLNYLTPANTLYWSDYCNVFHHPRSLLQLSSWEYDPIQAPKGRVMGTSSNASSTTSGGAATSRVQQFTGFDTGEQEFYSHDRDHDGAGSAGLESNFRLLLEECDLISGLNVITNVDSAWGGFSVAAMNELRDEYLPKTSVFVWGLQDGTPLDRAAQYSRIRTEAGLIPVSTMYIPLCLPSSPATLINKFLPADRTSSFDPSSPWHVAGLLAAGFETLTMPTRLRKLATTASKARYESLAEIAAQVSGNGTRTVAGDVAVGIGHGLLAMGSTNAINRAHMSKQDRRKAEARTGGHTFAKFAVVRGNDDDDDDDKNTTQSLDRLWDSYVDESRLRDEKTVLCRRNLPGLAFPEPASFPPFLHHAPDMFASMTTSSVTRHQFSDMNDFVSRYVRSDDREQLKDQIETLESEYEYGWSDQSFDDSD